MTMAIWAYSGIGPALSWWFKTLKLDRDSSQQVSFLLAFLHIRLSVLEASSHFSFLGMEWIVSTKIRRPGEQLEISVLGGRTVFRTFVLIQFEWGPEEYGAYIMSYCSKFSNFSPPKWPSQYHLLPWWLQWSADAPLTSRKPVIAFKSKSDLVTLLLKSLPRLPVAFSTNSKLLTLTRPCMTEPLLLSSASSQVPFSSLHSTLASTVTL